MSVNTQRSESKDKKFYPLFNIKPTTSKEFAAPKNWDSIDFNSISAVLKKVFGHDEFRSKLQQDACINACHTKKDLFISLPTGSGKSLIYQLPAMYQNNGLTIVVSPLVALINNQITNAQKIGIPCATINSTLPVAQIRKIRLELMANKTPLRLLYVTPEMVCSSSFQYYLSSLHKTKQLRMFAIDEAHCVSSWGHEFRPDYLKLGYLRNQYPDVQMMALTATATPKVLDDIIANLKLDQPLRYIASSFRKNLFYDVQFSDSLENGLTLNLKNFIQDCLGLQRTDEPIQVPNLRRKPTASEGTLFMSASSFVPCSNKSAKKDQKGSKSKGVGIVYCRTKATCEDIAVQLTRQGIKARPYHSGLSAKERKEIESLWMNEDILIICATISFGMGIDKPNVRLVVHYNMSQSLANYYQESGRAGRDGKQSYCRLYFSSTDMKAISYLLHKDMEIDMDVTSDKNISKEKLLEKKKIAKAALERFERMIEYCKSADRCRHLTLAKEFALGDDVDLLLNGCKTSCDYCTNPKDLKSRVEKSSGWKTRIANSKSHIRSTSGLDEGNVYLSKFDTSYEDLYSSETRYTGDNEEDSGGGFKSASSYTKKKSACSGSMLDVVRAEFAKRKRSK